ncbi:MAG TPA: hypothetical protein VG839_06820 [Asticcacaulis sp.]|nr:hypothetical protein [Asticcacaulis sp.]
MRAVLIVTAGLLATAPAAHAAPAAQADHWVDAHVSTLGVGGEFGSKVSPHFSLRAAANAFNYNYDTTSDNIQYTGKLKLGQLGGQVDYRFADANPFYLTAGLFANSNKITASATPASSTQVGLTTYTPAQIGTINADGKYKSSAPYLGLGWRWGAGTVDFNFEAGAYFQGKPTVTMSATGLLASQPGFQADLERERQDLQNTLNDLATYPVVTFGVGYKF